MLLKALMQYLVYKYGGSVNWDRRETSFTCILLTMGRQGRNERKSLQLSLFVYLLCSSGPSILSF